MIDTMFSWF
jgi:hypothetical protein